MLSMTIVVLRDIAEETNHYRVVSSTTILCLKFLSS